MSGTRILLVNLPRLLAGVVRGLVAQHDDLEIVGDVSTTGADDAVASARVDIMAIGVVESDDLTPDVQAARAQHPTLRVLLLDVAGHSATMHEADGERREVPEVSPAALLEMMRGR